MSPADRVVVDWRMSEYELVCDKPSIVSFRSALLKLPGPIKKIISEPRRSGSKLTDVYVHPSLDTYRRTQ